MAKRIAIIGAGAAGLSAARHSLAAGHECVVFEQGDRLGGVWVYSEQTSTADKPMHSGMYKDLVTNLPKEIMCYPDVPFPEQSASYIPSTEVLAYLDSFADRFALRPHIRFGQRVVRVRPIVTHQVNGRLDASTTSWEIIVDAGNTCTTHSFDAVFVCNGHLSQPKWPAYPGQFGGRLLHSHDFRDARAFAGRSVLVIGTGPSGLDIAWTLSQHAERVAVSSRNTWPQIPSLLPPSVERLADVRRFEGGEIVAFADGRRASFSDVIVCTGYAYSFPFLSADCGLCIERGAFVRPLFKDCVSIAHPSMFLLGLQSRVVPFQLVDYQARFCLAGLAGVWRFDRTEMQRLADEDLMVRKRLYGAEAMNRWHTLATLQSAYYADLSRLAGLDDLKPVAMHIYEESARVMRLHFGTFRRTRFRVVDDERFESNELDESAAKL